MAPKTVKGQMRRAALGDGRRSVKKKYNEVNRIF